MVLKLMGPFNAATPSPVFDFYSWLNFLIINTRDDSLGVLRTPYLVFNTFESFAWFYCAGFVFIRAVRHGTPRGELSYSAAFLFFGISDAIETGGTTGLLLLFKLASLLAICGYRGPVRAKYGSRYL